MPNDQQPNSSVDSEQQFYSVLASSGLTTEDATMFADVHRDFFDAKTGIQSGIRADGTPVLLMTLTPEGVKMIMDARDGWRTHQCHHAPEVGLYLLHVAADTLAPLLEHLSPEVQGLRPFGH